MHQLDLRLQRHRTLSTGNLIPRRVSCLDAVADADSTESHDTDEDLHGDDLYLRNGKAGRGCETFAEDKGVNEVCTG